MHYPFAEVRAATKKSNFAYNLFVWPSEPLTYLLVNFTPISANAVSLLAGAFGLLASLLYLNDTAYLAALSFAIFFLLDCSDGAIARLRDQASKLGGALDVACDRTVLTAAAITFGATAFQVGDYVAAGLCAAYFAAHSWLDLLWYRDEKHWAGLPSQSRQLMSQLRAQQRSGRRSLRGWGRLFSRIESALRPAPWVCNIIFLLGSCLFSSAQAPVFLSALTGIGWFNRAPVIRAWLHSRSAAS